jgi:ABC-2 type transport system ATP-binding protein
MTARPGVNGSNTWQISVTDEAAAEAQLLRVVMEDSQLTVTEFGRKKHNLEEVFMSIVGEEQHVG